MTNPNGKEQYSIRKITTIYADLHGWLQFRRQLSPMQLAAFIDAYYCEIGEIIQQFNGMIDKFMGDSMLALFNTRDEIDRPEHQAVAAAIALKHSVESRWPDLPLSAGVATGDAVVGFFGPSFHRTYTAFGDVVDRAVVLERRSRSTEHKILIDNATSRTLGEEISTKEHPHFSHPLMENEGPAYEVAFS